MNRIGSILHELEAQDLVAQGKYTEALPHLLHAYEKGEMVDRETLLNNIAICYLSLKDFSNARIFLEKAVSLNAENTTAVYNLAYCYLSLKNFTKAVETFQILTGKDGVRTDTAYNLGLAYLGAGQTAEAVQIFNKLMEKPLSPDLVYNIGITLIGEGKAAEARDIYISYLSKAGNDIDATFGLGIAYSRLAEFRKAIECFQRVIRWDSRRYISTYVSLGIAFMQIGDSKSALENLKKAIQLNPEMAEAWYYLGVFYETAGQFDSALNALKKAGEFNRSMPEVWEKLGHLLLRSGNYEESRISYKKAYKLTQEPRFAYKLALIMIVEKDYKSAKEYLQICLSEKVPDKENQDYKLTDIYENIAICSYYLEEYENSIFFGEKVLMSDMNRVFILFIVGSSSLKQGKLPEGRRYLLRGLNLKPDDVNILYSLGILEGNMSDFEKAEMYLERAASIQRNPDIIYALALTKMKLQKADEAADLFKEYQAYHKENPDILYKLGLLYIELKNYDRAKEAFQETLAIKPDNQRAREYLDSLEAE